MPAPAPTRWIADDERLYGCWRCGQRKPRRAFDMGPKGRQLARVCRDCRHAEAEAREARQTTRRLKNNIVVKRCSNCRHWKPRTTHFSIWKRWPDGRPRYWNSWCSTCIAERKRIDYRLRAEAEGREVKAYRGARQAPFAEGTGKKQGLAPEPLLEWLRAVIEREAPEAGRSANDPAERIGLDTQALAHQLGVDTRAIWRIQHAEHRTVSLAVADRLLTNYGRPVVIRSRDLEARLVAWARELPGNGTRLLRYMDRAEQVAHLADVSLMSLGDLWPELDA